MPLTIYLKDPDTGEELPLSIPDYEDITLAHWKAFNPLDEPRGDGEDELDNAIRKVCLYTGIPESTVERWTTKVFSTVLEQVSIQIQRAYKGSDNFRKCLVEGTEYIPEPMIMVGDKPYDVPLNMDKVLIAQFADWERWEPPTHEADIAAEACAFMLVESGKEYEGATADVVEAMRHLPMQQAFDLCAFFFSKSEAFVNVTSLRSRKFSDWTKHLLTATRKSLPSGTGGSTSSTALLN